MCRRGVIEHANLTLLELRGILGVDETGKTFGSAAPPLNLVRRELYRERPVIEISALPRHWTPDLSKKD
jgi:hypothetical protein